MPSYAAPTRLADALEVLRAGPRVVIAGATDHYPARVGHPWDEDILDVSRVIDLGQFGADDRGWWIPATTTRGPARRTSRASSSRVGAT